MSLDIHGPIRMNIPLGTAEHPRQGYTFDLRVKVTADDIKHFDLPADVSGIPALAKGNGVNARVYTSNGSVYLSASFWDQAAADAFVALINKDTA